MVMIGTQLGGENIKHVAVVSAIQVKRQQSFPNSFGEVACTKKVAL